MKNYFCGWYFKCQSKTKTIAVIAEGHRTSDDGGSSIQLITEDGAWSVPFETGEFNMKGKSISAKIKGNQFSEKGMRLCIATPELSAIGYLKFDSPKRIRYDIMGPFRFLPFMQCRHKIVSMSHSVNGELWLNNDHYIFKNANGYIEGDRGSSFPKQYAWSHTFFRGGSLMLSVAEIPLGVLNFTGVIAIVLWGGTEYRLATYLGAKVKKLEGGEIIIEQSDMTLRAHLIDEHSHTLRAPENAKMSRHIKESVICHASYTLTKGDEVILDFETDRASFEYEYEK